MKLTEDGTASITLLSLMLYKSYDVLQLRTALRSIQYKFYLEVSSLYPNFVPGSLNIVVNNIPHLMSDPVI